MFNLQELVYRILFLDQTLQLKGVMENDMTVEELPLRTAHYRYDPSTSFEFDPDTGELRVGRREEQLDSSICKYSIVDKALQVLAFWLF